MGLFVWTRRERRPYIWYSLTHRCQIRKLNTIEKDVLKIYEGRTEEEEVMNKIGENQVGVTQLEVLSRIQSLQWHVSFLIKSTPLPFPRLPSILALSFPSNPFFVYLLLYFLFDFFFFLNFPLSVIFPNINVPIFKINFNNYFFPFW